jgi:hypothetical protein
LGARARAVRNRVWLVPPRWFPGCGRRGRVAAVMAMAQTALWLIRPVIECRRGDPP